MGHLRQFIKQFFFFLFLFNSSLTYAAITNPIITNDATNIYFSFNEDKTFSYNQIYIDSDLNAKTGFYIGGIGADRLVENGIIYSHPPGTGWNWRKMQNVNFSQSGQVYKWVLPLATLGVALQCDAPVRFIFRSGNNNGGDTTQASDYKLVLGSNCGGGTAGSIFNPKASSTTTDFIFSYQASAPQEKYRVFLDTNQNASTGYPIGTIGAKFMLENNMLFSYEGPGLAWKPVKQIGFTTSTNNTVSWTLSRADINSNGTMDCSAALNYVYQMEIANTVVSDIKRTISYPSNANCSQPTPPPGKIAIGTTWNYVISTAPDLSIKAGAYDIDAFATSAAQVAAIHAQGSAAICYVDAGTWEDWRADANQFPASVKGRANGWPGELWLDIRQISIIGPIIQKRLDVCKEKGFDAVEFDNVDGYSNNTGFPLTAQDQLTFNTYLANQAHSRGMLAALKNDLNQVKQLVAIFDFAVNEQCFQYNECQLLAPFIAANKAVLNVEYSGSTASFCPQAKAMKFSSILKSLNLNNPVNFC